MTASYLETPAASSHPMAPPLPFHVVLFQPEIPPNTGNIIRLCAAAGAVLHLVGPLGFRLDAPALRRAGMDYRELATVRRYQDWDDYRREHPASRHFLITTQGETPYTSAEFTPGDRLLFGSEGHGVPPELHAEFVGHRLRIPLLPPARSLNLAVSVGIVLYEALRRNGFPQLG